MTAILLFFLIGSYIAVRADRLKPSELLAALRSADRPVTDAGVTVRAHEIFCGLFDRVYGPRACSAHRVGASLISTASALMIITLAIGPDNTLFVGLLDLVSYLYAERDVAESIGSQGIQDLFGISMNVSVLILALLILLPLNFAADFLSLAETRFIIGCARTKGLAAILALTVLDLVLTTIIFGLPVTVLAYNIGGRAGVFLAVDMVLTTNMGWPFLLTTFVTSFAWLLFASCALAVRAMRLHGFTRRLLENMAASDRPTVAFATIAYPVFVALWIPATYFIGYLVPTQLPQTESEEPAEIAIGHRYRAAFVNSATVQRVSFEGVRGVDYVIETDPMLFGDTLLRVSMGDSELEEDDDSGPGLGSRIELRAEESGTYVVTISSVAALVPVVGPLSTFDFVVRYDDDASPGEGSSPGAAGLPDRRRGTSRTDAQATHQRRHTGDRAPPLKHRQGQGTDPIRVQSSRGA